jgi:hypothetical protein
VCIPRDTRSAGIQPPWPYPEGTTMRLMSRQYETFLPHPLPLLFLPLPPSLLLFLLLNHL